MKAGVGCKKLHRGFESYTFRMMSPEAQAAYNDILKDLVLRNGTLVKEDPSIYGWVDYKYYRCHEKGYEPHHLSCEISSSQPPVEDYWREFNGTFNDEDDSVHGIVLKSVNCACGKLKEREFRWEGRMQEVAKAVFAEMFVRLSKDAN